MYMNAPRTVQTEQKRMKRVLSRTDVDRKLWCWLNRAVSHAEMESWMGNSGEQGRHEICATETYLDNGEEHEEPHGDWEFRRSTRVLLGVELDLLGWPLRMWGS